MRAGKILLLALVLMCAGCGPKHPRVTEQEQQAIQALRKRSQSDPLALPRFLAQMATWENASPPSWLVIQKESAGDAPDSPEQVCIIIHTSDGRKWLAVWEERKTLAARQ